MYDNLIYDQCTKSYVFTRKKGNIKWICGKGCMESEQIYVDLLGSSPTCKSFACPSLTK